MMVVRLGLIPAVTLSLLASAGVAGAQYYPYPAEGSASAAPVEEAEVPAAYDPYGNPAAGQPSSGAQPMIMAPPAGAAARQPAATSSGSGAIANAPYGNPATQPDGYPPGAYSGQQPAGMAAPYSAPAQQPAPTYSAAPPASVGTQPQNLNNDYGANGSSVAMLPPEDQPETGPRKELPAHLKFQVVDYVTKEAPGTIIVDTPNTYLYYVLPGGKAERYGIGVGREGFTWSGAEKISRKAEWPDWRPPAEMIERQPYLPRFMAGGPGNPMGARALYLGGTIYRIHGTNQPSTIGQFMSSGCIRMLNEDVEGLFEKVKVGTKVVVLPGNPPAKTAEAPVPADAATVQQVSAPAGVAVR